MILQISYKRKTHDIDMNYYVRLKIYRGLTTETSVENVMDTSRKIQNWPSIQVETNKKFPYGQRTREKNCFS